MGLLDFMQTPEGQGLLAATFGGLAGARKGAPINSIGRAGLAGLQGYSGAIDQQSQQAERAVQAKYRDMQMSQMEQSARTAQAQREAQQRALSGMAPEVQSAVQAGVPFADIWKHQNPEDKYEKVGDSLLKVGMGGISPVYTAPAKLPEWETTGPDGKPVLNPLYLDMKKQIAAAGRSVNTSTVNLPPIESEEQKALGKDLAEQYSGVQKAGMSATGTLNNLTRMKSLLTGIETGKLTPAQTEVSGVLDSLGIKIDPNLPQKQAAAALSNELALRAKTSGGENMMPGAMSDPDRRFLVEMVPGLANTPGGNAIIIETLARKAQRDQAVAKMAREYRTKNKTLNGFSDELADWSAKNPLFTDLQKTSPSAASSVRSAADAILNKGR